MGRPKAAVPDFDDQRPWGAYPPSAGVGAALALAHTLPPALSALTKLLRRPVKYGVTTPLDLAVWGLKLRLLPRGNMSEQKLYTAPQLFDRDEFALLAQRLKPGGIWYTPTSGIWQTVWLEPVPNVHLSALRIVPDCELAP